MNTTTADLPALVEWLDQRLYPEYEDRWDTKMFADALRAHLDDSSVVLDLGAGRGHLPELDIRDAAAHVCGVDPDEVVLTNRQLHEAHVVRDGRLPFDDETFDLVFSTHVWEHVESPIDFLREARRVLRPGGRYLSLTPNRRHYVGVLSTATPHRFHEWFNAKRGRDHEDTFPTYHRLNTHRAIEGAACASGFRVLELEAHEHRPEYLRFSTPTYLLGAAWERVVNASSRLAGLRVSLLAVLEATKPGAA